MSDKQCRAISKETGTSPELTGKVDQGERKTRISVIDFPKQKRVFSTG